MEFKVGDKVKLLNEVGEGEVVEVQSSSSLIVRLEDGFDYPYKPSDLIRKETEGTYSHRADEKEIQKKISSVTHSSYGNNKSHRLEQKYKTKVNLVKNAKGVLEVDLHLENLIETNRFVADWEKIEIQLEAFKWSLDQAIRQKMNKLIVIHGVGEGILREEVRKILDSYPQMEYLDGAYSEYGYGATEIRIFGLHS